MPYTLEQNKADKWKNYLVEVAWRMLHVTKLPTTFWVEPFPHDVTFKIEFDFQQTQNVLWIMDTT